VFIASEVSRAPITWPSISKDINNQQGSLQKQQQEKNKSIIIGNKSAFHLHISPSLPRKIKKSKK